MKARTSLRKPAVLSESTQRRLGIYALAASATGVTAMAQPAEGKVIYTPAGVSITIGGGYGIDFEHTKHLQVGLSLSLSEQFSWVHALASPKSGAVATASGYGAAALPAGARIGPARHFQEPVIHMATFNATAYIWYGPWDSGGKGARDHYLGVRLILKDGKTHYGWARISVISRSNEYGIQGVVVSGYAYETIPNKPIIAGKTKGSDVMTMPMGIQVGTLGHLARGKK